MTSRKLIVCADGAWDNRAVGSPSNVAKLQRVLRNDSDADANANQQIYHVGAALKWHERILPNTHASQLTKDLLEAYYFLIDQYKQGDQLFFFGVDRGAYTVRSLAGLLRASGLLRRAHRDQANEALRLYRDRSDRTHPGSGIPADFRAKYSLTPEIEFIGVWDTVGPLGLPLQYASPWNRLLQPSLWNSRFHDTSLSVIVRHAFQALSIHEQRAAFPACLWRKQAQSVNQVLEQVWFPGVHGDVGGGYRSTGLADIAFLWMVDKARGCGLLFRDAELAASASLAPDPLGRRHDTHPRWHRWLGRLLLPAASARRYDPDPVYGQSISSAALERFRLKPSETWPATFREVLQGGPGTASESPSA